MTKTNSKVSATESEEIRSEYDFSGGVRGKHAQSMKDGYTMTIYNADGTTTVKEVAPPKGAVILAADVLAYFPDAEAVNTALRTIINLTAKPHKTRVRKRKGLISES